MQHARRTGRGEHYRRCHTAAQDRRRHVALADIGEQPRMQGQCRECRPIALEVQLVVGAAGYQVEHRPRQPSSSRCL
jgi:hypothetical protein